MAITIYDVSSKDNKNYIYSGDTKKDIKLLMTFERNSDAHKQFLQAAVDNGSLILNIDNLAAALERLPEDIAEEHFTEIPALTTTKYIKYALFGFFGLVLMSVIFSKNKK